MSWRDYKDKDKKKNNILETNDKVLNEQRFENKYVNMWNRVQAQTINNLQNNQTTSVLNQESFDNIKKSISNIANSNYGRGNIDLNNRPVVKNDDGSISTVRSMSFYDDNEKKEILVPTVVNGKIVSDNEAINHYYNTGEYLGKFDNVEEANSYAKQLHKEQEKRYKGFEIKDILKYNQEKKKEEEQKRKTNFKNQLLNYNSQEAEKSNKIIKNGNIGEKAVEYGKEIGRSLLTGAVESVGNTTSMLYNLPTKLGNAIGLESVQQKNAKQGIGISPEDFTNNWKELIDVENQRTSELDNGLQTASRWSRTIGEMIPSILIGQGMAVGDTAVAMQKSASAVSSFMSALNSASSTYNKTLDEEQSNYLKAGLKATLYGIATHKIEGITGGNILNKFGSLDDLAVGGISKVAKNELQKKIGAIAYGVFGETLEENVENWVDHLIDYAFGDADDITFERLLEEAKQTSIDTSVVTLILQGIGFGGGTYNDVKMYEANQTIDNANYLTDKQKTEFKDKIEQEQNPYLARELLTGAIQEKIVSNDTTMQNEAVSDETQQVTLPENELSENKAPVNEVDINNEMYYNKDTYKPKQTKLQSITVAPYYNTKITDDNFEEIKNNVDEHYKNTVNSITNMFGGKVKNVTTNIGGYTFTEGENAGQMVNELSYTFELEDVDENTADLIASAIGDLGYEQQEAVIASNYTKINSKDANVLETRIKFNNIEGVKEALNRAGIQDYTIDTTNNTVKILDFDGNMGEVIAQFMEELGGNFNGTEWSKSNSRYYDTKARRGLYETWLAEADRNGETGELYNYITEAKQKAEERINSNDNTGNKLLENTDNKVDINQNQDYNTKSNSNNYIKSSKNITRKEANQVASEVMTWRINDSDGRYFIDLSKNGYKSYIYDKSGNNITVVKRIEADEDTLNKIRKDFENGTFKESETLDKYIKAVRNEIRTNTANSSKLQNRGTDNRDVGLPNNLAREQGRDNRTQDIRQNSRNGLENSQNEGSFSLEKNEFSNIKDMSDEKVAEILSKPYSKKEATTRLKAIAMREIVDKGYIYENLDLKAKDTKNRTLQSHYNRMLHSYSQAQYTIAKGHIDYGDKGIYEIRAEIPEEDQQDFNEYAYHYLNIDRMSLEEKAQKKLETLNKELEEAKKKLKESYDIDRAKQKEKIKSLNNQIKYFEGVKNKPVFRRFCNG